MNLLSTMRLAQSILKCKFPSVDKPLQINISPSKNKPWGLFLGFYSNLLELTFPRNS